MSRLTDEVGRLAAAGTAGPWYSDERYVVGMVAGGRPNGETIMAPYRSEMGVEEKCANAQLTAAFGSPDRVLAAVEALEADGHKWLWRLGVSAVLHASDCGGCAVIRSWEQALGIAE